MVFDSGDMKGEIMNVLINIDEKLYDDILYKAARNTNLTETEKIIAQGTPISGNAAECDIYTEGYFKGYDDGLERKLED